MSKCSRLFKSILQDQQIRPGPFLTTRIPPSILVTSCDLERDPGSSGGATLRPDPDPWPLTSLWKSAAGDQIKEFSPLDQWTSVSRHPPHATADTQCSALRHWGMCSSTAETISTFIDWQNIDHNLIFFISRFSNVILQRDHGWRINSTQVSCHLTKKGRSHVTTLLADGSASS